MASCSFELFFVESVCCSIIFCVVFLCWHVERDLQVGSHCFKYSTGAASTILAVHGSGSSVDVVDWSSSPSLWSRSVCLNRAVVLDVELGRGLLVVEVFVCVCEELLCGGNSCSLLYLLLELTYCCLGDWCWLMIVFVDRCLDEDVAVDRVPRLAEHCSSARRLSVRGDMFVHPCVRLGGKEQEQRCHNARECSLRTCSSQQRVSSSWRIG